MFFTPGFDLSLEVFFIQSIPPFRVYFSAVQNCNDIVDVVSPSSSLILRKSRCKVYDILENNCNLTEHIHIATS